MKEPIPNKGLIFSKGYKENNDTHTMSNGETIKLPAPEGSEYLYKRKFTTADILPMDGMDGVPISKGDMIWIEHIVTNNVLSYSGVNYLWIPIDRIIGVCNNKDYPADSVYGINGFTQVKRYEVDEEQTDSGVIVPEHTIDQTGEVVATSESLNKGDVIKYAYKADYPCWYGATEIYFVKDKWIFERNGEAYGEYVMIDISDQEGEVKTDGGLILKKKHKLRGGAWGEVVSYNGKRNDIEKGNTVFFKKNRKDFMVGGFLYVNSSEIGAKQSHQKSL